MRRLGGVGPATAERLRRLRVETIGDLAAVAPDDLVSLLGQASGTGLHRLALALDDRPVVPEREAKSVSAEETFGSDLTDPALLRAEIERLAERVGTRLRAASTYGRTVTLKVRRYDFSTLTRSSTLPQSTDDPRQLARTALALLRDVDVTGGVRLLGLGVSGLSDYVQEDLFADTAEEGAASGPPASGADAVGSRHDAAVAARPGPHQPPAATAPAAPDVGRRTDPGAAGRAPPLPPAAGDPGQDVTHREHGARLGVGVRAGAGDRPVRGPDDAARAGAHLRRGRPGPAARRPAVPPGRRRRRPP